jgi:hypothetical protein
VALIEPDVVVGGMCVAGGIGLRDLGNETTFQNTLGHQWAMLNSKYYGVGRERGERRGRGRRERGEEKAER